MGGWKLKRSQRIPINSKQFWRDTERFWTILNDGDPQLLTTQSNNDTNQNFKKILNDPKLHYLPTIRQIPILRWYTYMKDPTTRTGSMILTDPQRSQSYQQLIIATSWADPDSQLRISNRKWNDPERSWNCLKSNVLKLDQSQPPSSTKKNN